MTSLALGAIGTAIGGPIGGFIGGTIGSFIDQALFKPPGATTEGPRITDLATQSHSPGSPIIIPYGQELPAQGSVIWTSRLIETRHEEEVEGGKGPGGGSATVVSYTYAVDVALMVCEGPVNSIKRIWANNKLLYEEGSFSRVDDIRIALGSQSELPDAMIEAAEGIGLVPAFRGRCVVYLQNLQLADFGNVTPAFKFEIERGSTPDSLSYVVSDLCNRAGLTEGVDYDISCLQKDAVRGFGLSDITTPRAAIEALQRVYPFDSADTGYLLNFRERNRRADAIIDAADFGAREFGDGAVAPEPTTRTADLEIPHELILVFLDPARELDQNSVNSPKLSTTGKQQAVFRTPIVMSPSKARESLDDLLSEYYAKRMEKQVTLPVKYLALDSDDIVQIRRSGALSQRWRIGRIEIGADWIIKATITPHIHRWARPTKPADSQPNSVLSQTIPFTSDTDMELLDVPLLTDTIGDNTGFYALGFQAPGTGNKWTGWNLYQALDGSTFERMEKFQVQVIAGSCTTTLTNGPTDYYDVKNTVRVNFFSSAKTPTTTTDHMLQFNVNGFVCGASTRWEAGAFRDATLVSGLKYDLSYLSRGRRGTEHNTGNHAAGDRFYVLSMAGVHRIEQPRSQLNASIAYKGVTHFQTIASAVAETFKNTGVSFKPWSGVNMTGARSGNDLTVNWTRRNRQFGGWNNGGDVPMTEASEHYELDILDVGATVLRTITASTPTAVYTSAQQVTDFGSPQSTVTINVFQISQAVGRGYVLNDTV